MVRNLTTVVADHAVEVGSLSAGVQHRAAAVPDLGSEVSDRAGAVVPPGHAVPVLAGGVGGVAGVVRRANRVAKSFTNWSSPNDGGAFLAN